MLHTVPIYTANVRMQRFSVTGPKKNVLKAIDSVVIKSLVVKGFNIKSIVSNNLEKFIKKAQEIQKLQKNQKYVFGGIELLQQHGKGINDLD